MGNKTRPVGDKWAINHGLLAQTKMNVSPQGGVLSASSCRITIVPALRGCLRFIFLQYVEFLG